MRSRVIQRDWSEALEAHEGLGCRAHGDGPCDGPLQLAHVVGRVYDPWVGRSRSRKRVLPEAVVRLCRLHHDRYDGRCVPALNLMPHITQAEFDSAAERAGEKYARRRIMGRGALNA